MTYTKQANTPYKQRFLDLAVNKKCKIEFTRSRKDQTILHKLCSGKQKEHLKHYRAATKTTDY